MEKIGLHKSLHSILRPAHANAAERAGIETLAVIAHMIERFGLRRSFTLRRGYFFAGYESAPHLSRFGAVSWGKVLEELSAAGFDWQQHVVKPFASSKLSEHTTADLQPAINRRIEERIKLLSAYQLRSPSVESDHLNSVI